MRTETLSTLKINKLSQEQYDRELANGNIDENAIYLTPDTDLDLAEIEQTLKEQGDEIELVKGDLTSHTNSSNAQFALVREEFVDADAETLKSAKEYSDANKNSAIGEAKAYTDSEIEKLVTDTEFEGVLSTIQDIQNAMATDEELAQALETANGKKVDKGAKGSATQPIYFDDNGAQPIAYTIEKSVPADAKFTDTTYTLIKDSTNKKIQLMNGETLVSEVDDNNTTYTIDTSLSTSSTNPIQNKVVAENISNLQENINANASEIEELNSKDLFETKHEEGNAIAVNDSAEAPFVGMKLYGKTEQNGTPTPTSPIELKSVGDSGSFTVELYGKNLMEQTLTSRTYYGLTITVNEDKSVTLNGSPTITWTYFYRNLIDYLEVGETYIFGGFNSLEMVRNGVTSYVNPNAWVEITEDITSLRPYIQVQVGQTRDNYTVYPYVMNSKDYKSPYEPPTKQTLTMPYTLRSVGDIKDEVDFNRGVLIQRFVNIDLGTLSYKYDSGSLRFIATLTMTGKKDTRKTKGLCEIYDIKSNGESFNGEWNNVAYVTYTELYIHDRRYTDASAFKSAMSGIKLIYELETPIETPLSETELNAYKQLHTNKPNTTILSEADMEVDYVVDSTSAEYIENRLDTLKSDIDKISSGGSTLATVATTGDYNDLSNKPTIPTKTSQLTNDSSFVNQTGLNTALEDKLSFDEEVINSTSDVAKVVPEGSGKYAAVNKVGGMSYKSRNLLPYPYTATSTPNGITYTVSDEDGSITVNGTSTNFSVFNLDTQPNLINGKTYSFTSGVNAPILLLSYINTKTNTTVYEDTIITWSSEYSNPVFYLQISPNVTVNNVKIYPRLYEGTEATTYEPYYSGFRNAYVTGIKSVGANKLNLDEMLNDVLTKNSDGSYTLTKSNNNAGRFSAFAETYIPANTPLWLNGESVNYTGTASFWLCVQFEASDGTMLEASNYGIGNAFSFNKDIVAARLFLLGQDANGTISTIKNVYLVASEEKPEKYIPYKENTFIIPTGARGVGYGLGINEDCYNYIDFERKVYVQNCVKVNLGTLTWNMPYTNIFYTDGITEAARGGAYNSEIQTLLCNGYEAGCTSGENKGIYGSNSSDKVIAFQSGVTSSTRLSIKDLSYTDAASLKASLADTWLIYPLATPIETDISDYIQDNFIEVAAGGVITAVNEYGYDVPTEYEFYTSENPEKVMVGDTFIGEFIGNAKIKELNVNHMTIGEGCNLVYDTINKCVSFQFI